LVLCVTAATLLARSYFTADGLTVYVPREIPPPSPGDYHFHFGSDNRRALHACTNRGLLGIFSFDPAWASPSQGRVEHHAAPPIANPRFPTLLGRLGFHARLKPLEYTFDPADSSAPIGDIFTVPHVLVPLWFILAITAILPATAFRRRIKRRRSGSRGFEIASPIP
jgi:hypothetical protein